MNNWYLNNPLVHENRRRHLHSSSWVSQFDCQDLKPLIICRGPIRKEAMDVFDEMGIHQYGILLSEKDSITYPNALAPELRILTDPNRVHQVADYSGATKEERVERISQIIHIAHTFGYNSIFAGYGFMSEDEDMVLAMEQAGLLFIGPCSKTQRMAGLKDQAKRTALDVGVSTTPGCDRVTLLTLLKKAPTLDALMSLARAHQLTLSLVESELEEIRQSERTTYPSLGKDLGKIGDVASQLLDLSYQAGLDLYTLEEMSETLQDAVRDILDLHPNRRIRLKAISGGGGKGQRILPSPASMDGDSTQQVNAVLNLIPGLALEILNEVKCNGVGDNKNILAELNIETTRHQEIQVVGNGQWCMTLGGRDCSLQMHEQKLLEVSVTVEELEDRIEYAQKEEDEDALSTLQSDLKTLIKMEEEASLFGKAVGLDSVSTFECIVEGKNHYFMEMNTRIQVEHRVSELCYAVQFTNPQDQQDFFIVHSLVELMVLLARWGKALPKPTRIPRLKSAVEARLNATNDALRPHAGGTITDWSHPVKGEVRDDQGISLSNPDTQAFMSYHLAGAYDSNIALLLTTGDQRQTTYENLAEVLRKMKLEGDSLATNLQFHYGLVLWFLGRNVHARPTTRFIVPYLTAVGTLKKEMEQLDLGYAYHLLSQHLIQSTPNHNHEHQTQIQQAIQNTLTQKETLILRPLRVLQRSPHLLSGWLSHVHTQVNFNEYTWTRNPLLILKELYSLLNMNWEEDRPAAQQIWKHDDALCQSGLQFYTHLQKQLNQSNWVKLNLLLNQEKSPISHWSDQQWETIRATHYGHQLGLEMLMLIVKIAQSLRFFDLRVNPDLSIHIPSHLEDPELQKDMNLLLAPPPQAKSDEIVAVSGGMFYPREAPHLPPFVNEGTHFEEGQALYIVEVMKMFNKVYAPFSGTITEILIEGEGVIIKKGQPLFKIKPDVELIHQSAEEENAHKKAYTQTWIGQL